MEYEVFDMRNDHVLGPYSYQDAKQLEKSLNNFVAKNKNKKSPVSGPFYVRCLVGK